MINFTETEKRQLQKEFNAQINDGFDSEVLSFLAPNGEHIYVAKIDQGYQFFSDNHEGFIDENGFDSFIQTLRSKDFMIALTKGEEAIYEWQESLKRNTDVRSGQLLTESDRALEIEQLVLRILSQIELGIEKRKFDQEPKSPFTRLIHFANEIDQIFYSEFNSTDYFAYTVVKFEISCNDKYEQTRQNMLAAYNYDINDFLNMRLPTADSKLEPVSRRYESLAKNATSDPEREAYSFLAKVVNARQLMILMHQNNSDVINSVLPDLMGLCNEGIKVLTKLDQEDWWGAGRDGQDKDDGDFICGEEKTELEFLLNVMFFNENNEMENLYEMYRTLAD